MTVIGERIKGFYPLRMRCTEHRMLSELRRRHKVSNSTIRFEDVTFRAHVVEHEKSTFLGYADATLVVDDGIVEGVDLKLRIRGIQVKLLNGSPRMDLPQERGNDGKWYPIVFPKTAETRVALTEALFADRMVNAVATTVLEDQAIAAAS